MIAFVLDCSVTMAWCFADEANEQSDKALSLLTQSKALVPNLWSIEVVNVLSVAERKQRLTAIQSNTFINLLQALPIEIDIHNNGLPNTRVLEISREHQISAYDASYLELAERKNIPLASFDKALCEAAKASGISII